eukprot:353830-Chlamydomonas_euryale.AAC.2
MPGPHAPHAMPACQRHLPRRGASQATSSSTTTERATRTSAGTTTGITAARMAPMTRRAAPQTQRVARRARRPAMAGRVRQRSTKQREGAPHEPALEMDFLLAKHLGGTEVPCSHPYTNGMPVACMHAALQQGHLTSPHLTSPHLSHMHHTTSRPHLTAASCADHKLSKKRAAEEVAAAGTGNIAKMFRTAGARPAAARGAPAARAAAGSSGSGNADALLDEILGGLGASKTPGGGSTPGSAAVTPSVGSTFARTAAVPRSAPRPGAAAAAVLKRPLGSVAPAAASLVRSMHAPSPLGGPVPRSAVAARRPVKVRAAATHARLCRAVPLGPLVCLMGLRCTCVHGLVAATAGVFGGVDTQLSWFACLFLFCFVAVVVVAAVVVVVVVVAGLAHLHQHWSLCACNRCECACVRLRHAHEKARRLQASQKRLSLVARGVLGRVAVEGVKHDDAGTCANLLPDQDAPLTGCPCWVCWVGGGVNSGMGRGVNATRMCECAGGACGGGAGASSARCRR